MELEYPQGIPAESKALIELERFRADKEFREQGQPGTLEHRALRWVCRVLGSFAQQACELARTGQWTPREVREAVNAFRLSVVQTAHFALLDGRRGWVDRVFGDSIDLKVRQAIENSPEWQQYQDALLKVAEDRARPRNPLRETGLGGERTAATQDGGLLAAGLADDSASRKQRLNEFLREHKATIADIVRSSGVYKPDFYGWRVSV